MRQMLSFFLACALAMLCAPSLLNAQPVIDWQSGGPITTGGGYDMPTGAVRRSVVDFEVPGSVGKYPLRCARTLISRQFSFDTGGVIWIQGQEGEGSGASAAGPSATPTDPDDDSGSLGASGGGQGVVTFSNSFWYFDFAYALLHGDIVVMPNGTFINFSRGAPFGVKERLVQSPGMATLILEDGGRVEFITADSEKVGRIPIGATRIVDPQGVSTTIELDRSERPKRVVDASGRWIEFEYQDHVVKRVTSSAGQWVDFELKKQPSALVPLIVGAKYPDGTTASYVFSEKNEACDINLPVRMRDVRSTSRMQEINYEWHVERIKGRGCVLHKELSASNVEVSRREDVYREIVPGNLVRHFQYDDPNLPQLLMGESLMHSPRTLDNGYGVFRRYDYDARGFLSSITDPLKRVTAVENTPVAGKIEKITYPDKSWMRFAYTDRDNPYYVGEVEDTRRQKTFYEYFPNGSLRRIVYPPGGGEESWDDLTPYAQPRLHVLTNGAREFFEFDAAGRRIRHWLPTRDPRDPRTDLEAAEKLPHESRSYYPDGHPWEDLLESTTDPRGKKTVYEYAWRAGARVSGRPLPTKIINPDLTFKSFVYDIFGNLRFETDEEGHTTTYEYDAYSRLTLKVDPLGGETKYSYQPLIRLPEKRAPTGSLGITNDPDRGPLSWTLALPSTVTTPEGRVTQYLYDAESRLVLMAEGNHPVDKRFKTFEYDDAGNLKRQTDGLRATTYDYDDRNRLKVKVTPGSLTSSWDYDDAGNILKITHPDNTTESFTYDAMGRKETHTDELKRTTTWTYYNDGTVRTVVDPEKRQYGYVYDASGRLTDEYGPAVEFGATQLDSHREYDGAGNLTLRRDARGIAVGFVYDDRGREIERTYSNGASTLYTAYYDDSRIKSVADAREAPPNAVARVYDDNGRLKTETQTVRGLRPHVITYDYDRDGLQTGMSGPHAMSTTTIYTQLGEPHFIRDALGDLVEYTYARDGQRKSKRVGRLGREDFGFDDAGRRNSSKGQAPAPSRTHHYNPRSHPDETVGTGPGGAITEAFDYHLDTQLWTYQRSIRDSALRHVFTYDGSGNRLTSPDGSYALNGRNQYTALSGRRADTFKYDEAGNLTERRGWTYTYDAESRLASAEGNEEFWQFFYDPVGRLSSIERNGELRYAVYDEERPILWYSRSNLLLESTVWGPKGDEPIASFVSTLGKNGGGVYYYTDQLNNVVQTSTEDGKALERYAYDPFGQPHYFDPATLQERAESAVKPPHLFSGKSWFAPLGLYHSRARTYDPALGRFLQMDPLRAAGGDLNLYRYVKNAPATHVDPKGTYIETGIDLLSFSMGAASFARNIKEGNYFDAAVDGIGMGIDLGGLLLPGTVAAGILIKTGRHADDVADIARGVENAADVVHDVGAVGDAAHTAKAAEMAATAEKAGDAAGGGAKVSTLKPGPYAKESIPAHRGRPTAGEQRDVNGLMEKHGCHTCGTKNPGTKSGNAVADHQPPQKLDEPKDFYPHCIDCARRQGGEVLQEIIKRGQ